MNREKENDSFSILLGVSGSIAAFRAVELASALSKEGYLVDTVLTPAATQFITPLSFECVTKRKAYTDAMFSELLNGSPLHIELARRARLVLLAPATADLIAQYALGLAPNLLTSLLLATLCPVWIAPAMNVVMWHHPAVQKNVQLLKERGVVFIGPDEGELACGDWGKGRLWPVEGIFSKIISHFPLGDSQRKRLQNESRT
ncbi:phosphopantothenoylcysteine synthase [Candidatus Methylacidiphilum infernorum]|uniref:Phosphopantothenoylcysteine synthase n=1 Tax=Candidatus Methylacidiphilum infernorum TaxID=511746 RepID=A0ABX7PWT7_9BACT|nr:flavoprotein [Candidatus Methylacidiphilum infernorum]QSR87471.1 phosphopantothenoylcysteine synthase [Candidatus Methylacidiphilum infernorum]